MRRVLLAAGLVGLLACDHPRLHGRITELARTGNTYLLRFSTGDCAIRSGDGALGQEYEQLALAYEAQRAVWTAPESVGEKQDECYFITAPPQ